MRCENLVRSPKEIFEAELCRTKRLLQTAKQNWELGQNKDIYATQIASLERRLSLLRMPIKEDMVYRKELGLKLPPVLKKHPKAAKLRFHGTSITSVEKIIESGVISSAVDHRGIRMSNDIAGQISITNCENVGISVKDYMCPHDYAMPLRCLFVIEVASPNHYNNWNMPNVPLIGNRLFKVRAILTSPESSVLVRKILGRYGYNPNLASECFDFCK